MREILFRGKHLLRDANDKKAWVYGSLLCHANENPKLAKIETGEVDEGGLRLLYIVDASSIGQYTGLTDKNGTKIFEGDIIKTIIGNVIVTFRAGGFKGKVIGKHFYYDLDDGNFEFVEVIDNIYDNPELLEESK